jgi:hypothetical protein
MQGFRRAAVTLALAAMALRALVPAGWMPNPHGFAETAFIICDMGEMSPMAMAKMDMAHMDMAHMDMAGMDMSGMSNRDGDSSKDQAPARQTDDGHQQACPFAAAPHVATPSIVAMLLPPSVADGFSHGPNGQRVAVQSAHYAPQSPRAPPRLA